MPSDFNSNILFSWRNFFLGLLFVFIDHLLTSCNNPILFFCFSALALVSWLTAGEDLLFWLDLHSRFRSMVPALLSRAMSSAGEGITVCNFCQVDCFSIPFSQLLHISSLDFL
jgi:hypothetical protein